MAKTYQDLEPQGHNEACAICGKPCDALAGNPDKWPVGFCHVKSYGVLSWHHSSCVAKELEIAKQVRKIAILVWESSSDSKTDL